jgi:PAS domain S-box-containing protein
VDHNARPPRQPPSATDVPPSDPLDRPRLSGDTFRSLLQHANDLVYAVSIDPDRGAWRLEFLSDRVYELSGCRPSEFVEGGRLGSGGPFGLKEFGSHCFELLHPDDAPATLAATRKLAAGERVTREYRIRNRKTGEYRWVEDRSEPEKDDHGRVVGIWGIVRDITERRQREDALSQLAAIVDASDDAIVGLSPSGEIRNWNPAATTTYGYTAEEVLGREFFAIVAPDGDEMSAAWLEAVFDRPVRQDDAVHLARDGGEIPVSMTASGIRDSAGRPRMIAVVVRDRTQQKKLERQLVQSQKMEAVGRLAGGIAHDFNNILTVILGLSETLIEDITDRDPEAMAEDLRTIWGSASRAASLTRQLLAFSRKQLLQPRPISLDSEIEDMRGMLERLIGEDIDFSIRTMPAGTVLADPTQFHQVVLNLVVNARDAMPAGGRLVLETDVVDLDATYAGKRIGSRPGSYAMLAVSDSGAGMAPETMQQIFDPFFTTKDGGTGLGLSTVYGIVKQSGGNVWAYSEPGIGTTFKVYLPLIDMPAPAVSDISSGLAVTEEGQGTVLLVEDEDGVRRLVRSMLEASGYAVLEAPNGLEACTIAEEHLQSIDLVLTDLVMPRMGGLELVRRIREHRPELPVLYTSGYTEGFMEPDLAGPGAAFLQKPFSKMGLVRRIQDILAESQ